MDPKVISGYGAIIVSVVALLIYLGAHVVVLLLKSDTMLNILIGTDSALATMVAQYWVGSSAGSSKKDDIIAAQKDGGHA
jgi:hypothetical protein